jgi:hypothetical protein
MDYNTEMRNLLNLMEAGFNPDKHEMNEQHIKDLAEEALHAAARSIQDTLGVESGDVAGIFFTGPYADKIHEIFEMYIKYELMHMNKDQE